MKILYKIAVFSLMLALWVLPEVHAQTYDVRIAVVLPYKSKLSEGTKSLEFYRGMLTATDEMRRKGVNVLIRAYDEQDPAADLQSMFEAAFENVDIAVGCFYRSHIISASRVAAASGKMAIFPFASYIPQESADCPSAIFTIPSPSLYTQTCTTLLASTLGKCNVIWVKSPHPQTTAETDDLLSALRKKNCKINVITACDTGAINSKLSTKRHNLIVTDTNDLDFVERLITTVDAANTTDRQEVSVVGTSGWIAMVDTLFRKPTKCSLIIPSTWYQDNSNLKIGELFDYHKRWFHAPVADLLPSPFLLGYELGHYIIDNLRTNPSAFPAGNVDTPQCLSRYDFVKTYDTRCYTNAGLRLIRRAADGSITQIQLQNNPVR